jgi:CopA family copper-resistance protein
MAEGENKDQHAPASPMRRRVIHGLALGGVAAGLGWRPATAAAASSRDARVLAGTEFALEVVEVPIDVTGAPRHATVVDGRLPGPTLRWREGTTVTLRVTNRLRAPTSIHWHGILLPADMDGVPGLGFDGIAPGETYTYRFPVRQSGTYWYHGHSGFQEQTGLAGALVIDPAGVDPVRADREHVILLGDWTDADPAAILARLKKHSETYGNGEPTFGDLRAAAARLGWRAALGERRMWARMRMNPRDLVDVSGRTCTYLVNGMTPTDNWTGLFTPGERVRLRLINGSANSFFDLRIPGLGLTVVAADGQAVQPVEVDELRIAAAEVYDLVVEPREARAYTIFAQSIDRSGYARGTLAPRPGMQAPVPPLDPVPVLGMIDMGMAHPDSSKMHGMSGMSAHAMHASPTGPGRGPVHHAATEYGPGVDMRVDAPRDNLDDPGVGLRDNGRRVLSYADLHTLGGSLHPGLPTRNIELHLTGSMQRFIWSFDGVPYADAEPIPVALGEHVRLVLVNDTMMTHPIHLHGMWSELEAPDGRFLVRKHTVSVQPAQRVAFRVKADTPGRWAFHCHLLYHMHAGMFREVLVA